MKKKILSVICMVLVLLQVMLFAGCDNSNSLSSDNEVAQGNNANETTEKTDGKAKSWRQVVKEMPKKYQGKTVEYFTTYPMDEIPGVSAAVSAFEKASGVKVKWTVVGYNSYDTELNSRMAAGNIPDVVFTQGIVFSRFKHFQPISNLSFDFSDKAWDQQTMEDFTIKGKVYGVHLSPEYTYMHQPQAFFYNKDLIKKYDLEDPYKLWKSGKWTFNKMLEISKIYNEETGNPGFSFASIYEYPMMKGVCAGPFAFDGQTVTNTFKTVNINSLLQEEAKWKKSGLLCPLAMDMKTFEDGEKLSSTFNFGTCRYSNAKASKMKQNGTFGVVPLPAIDGQETYYQIMGEYEAYCIPKGAKEAEIVPYFLRAVFDKSNYDVNKFFCSKEAAEVYEWCMKQTRVRQTYLFTGQTQTENDVEVMSRNIWNANENTVSTEVAKGKDTLDAETSTLNNMLKDF